MKRENFPQKIRETLAKRVGYQCSNPGCQKLTMGPQESQPGTASVGVAAHITAAAPGGPRYDPALTPEERKHQDNGIHLCQNCATLIDKDPNSYPTDKLQDWKRSTEERISRKLHNPNGITPVPVEADPISPTGRRRVEPASPHHEPPCVASVDSTEHRYSARSGVNLDGHRVNDKHLHHQPSPQHQIQSVTIKGIGKFKQQTTAHFGASNIIFGPMASGKSLLCKLLTNKALFEQGEDESYLSVPNGSYATINWSDSKPTEYKIKIYDDAPRTYINGVEVLAITLPYKIIELTKMLPRFVDESKEIEVLGQYFSVSPYEMTNVLKWLIENSQVTQFEYSLKLLRKTQQILVKTGPTGLRMLPISSLSASEQSLVLVDIAMALSHTNSTQSPTLLLIDKAEALPSLDPTNTKAVIDAIGGRKGAFQVVICTHNISTDWNLDGYTLTEIILHNPYRRDEVAEFVPTGIK